MKTTWNDIEVLIVGAGTMGASLAQNYAQNGFHVGLLDVSEPILARGLHTIEQELTAVRGRIFSAKDIEAIRSRIIGGINYEEACKGKSLKIVIEAATERIDIKQKIFKQLDQLTNKNVVLATNSSSLDTNVLSAAVNRPDKVVWMHYFYLPHKNRAAEYAGTDTASDESKAVAKKFLKLGGKLPTFVRSSRKGGVADIIFVALLLEATRMVEEGFDIVTIEAAGIKAYDIPMGFLKLMDATGLAIGLASMYSFSDGANGNDPLHKVYGNFFTPTKVYVDLVSKYDKAEDKSKVVWIEDDAKLAKAKPNQKVVDELCDRFLAVGFMTASECVDAGMATVEDVELLTQNAFLWRKGPFTLMNETGSKRVAEIIKKREELAKKLNQTFPVSALLKKAMGEAVPWSMNLPPVYAETENSGVIRRIVLSNPKASNAMDNTVFTELRKQFQAANDDKNCKVIIFDTAPIKSFIAGADVKTFVNRIHAKEYDAIKRDTAEWQDVIFHVMTGTKKPKIAIVDGQAFGGGVEVASAFANDPNSIVLITNRTSYTLPETKLGIFPGLRGTLTIPQIIYKKTGSAATAVGLTRYFTLAAGTTSASSQLLYHLGFADAIVPAHRRDDAAETIANAIIANAGKILSKTELDKLKFERLSTQLSDNDKMELKVAEELFTQSDLVPTLSAQANGYLPMFYTGETKTHAERIAKRVLAGSPNAVMVANLLISRGMEGFLAGIDGDTLAEFELEHYLQAIFEHPDARLGLEALLSGRFPDFRRRYPLH